MQAQWIIYIYQPSTKRYVRIRWEGSDADKPEDAVEDLRKRFASSTRTGVYTPGHKFLCQRNDQIVPVEIVTKQVAVTVYETEIRCVVTES